VALALVLTFATASQALARFSALIIDAESGESLYSANADLPRYPASLTKMMTLYLLFEAVELRRTSLGDVIEFSSRAASQPPSKLGLRPGGQLSVENAILALVTKSANDAAVAVGEHLAGSEWRFAQAMTAKARQLGMSETTFQNASGLPDPDQVTTARDMAILARALVVDFPQYYHYFGTRAFYYRGAAHRNHNRMLFQYDGVDGIKTGFIRASGFNLVASAQRGGRRLIGVVFGARSPGERGRIMASLLDNGFSQVSPDTYARDILTASAGSAPDSGEPQERPSAAAAGAAVLLGSFASRDAATAAARAAQRGAPQLLGEGEITIVPVKGRGRRSATRYQARIVELDGGDAVGACKILNAQRRAGCQPKIGRGSVTREAAAAVPQSKAAREAAMLLSPTTPAKTSVKTAPSRSGKVVEARHGKSKRKVITASSGREKTRSSKGLSAVKETHAGVVAKDAARAAVSTKATRSPGVAGKSRPATRASREEARASCSSRPGGDRSCPLVR
jgi:D-alanyl-D-alanine carboxypeptidase